ncbi:TetR-like C-terminal domain-containing protein [Streptomyces sp. NPDC021218]|uniref:TetR-like C-terminal domain-containing protein n=1 Tax=Streptomyces sp. NPDC021218 TaxID=3365119 RepID=UPI0037AD2333
MPDTGSLRGDLKAYFSMLAEQINGREGAVLTGLFVAMRNDSDLAARLRPSLAPEPPPGHIIRTRATEYGELPPGCCADITDEVSGPVLFIRSQVRGLPLDARFVEPSSKTRP